MAFNIPEWSIAPTHSLPLIFHGSWIISNQEAGWWCLNISIAELGGRKKDPLSWVHNIFSHLVCDNQHYFSFILWDLQGVFPTRKFCSELKLLRWFACMLLIFTYSILKVFLTQGLLWHIFLGALTRNTKLLCKVFIYGRHLHTMHLKAKVIKIKLSFPYLNYVAVWLLSHVDSLRPQTVAC